MEVFRFEQLNFTYPLKDRPALTDISFSVAPSEFIVICGKSGCGKSTLLRHMKKNLTPYGAREGNIYYENKKIQDINDRKGVSEIGFVQQNPDNQIVTDKVWHELAFGLESLGYSNSSIKRKVAEMASYFGIQSWFRKSVDVLSGGQKQLLNLASVMAMQPKVLILDEPTAQLDPIAASEFLMTVYKINRDLGLTVIISEHRLEEVFPMADRVMVMEEGKILAFDSPRKIGRTLIGTNGKKHPMFYGLPSVMRIFQNEAIEEDCPLTIREGRLKMEKLLEDRETSEFELPDPDKNISIDRPVIALKNIWFRYSKKSDDVLRGLSFDVLKGEWFCALGGNGVGKSTTLKIMSNIIKPQRGTVEIENVNYAMVPQNPQALFTEITCEEELFEGLNGIKIGDAVKIDKVNHMLKLMEIEHLRKVNPYDLSGGEQQRLAIGKILLLEPQLLLLDEPTKGLDPFFKRSLAEILKKLKSKGVTIFMVSHDIEFCAQYGDRCAMFFDGEVVSTGNPREFFSGNSFYTTTANQIARKWLPNAITCEEVTEWLKMQI